MANITEEHLHHMAKRHHHTMRKLDALKDKFAGVTQRFLGTLETGAGAFLGGAIEGKTDGGTVLHVPINLGLGAVLLAAGHLDLAGKQYSEHLNNVGNGFIGSYLAATGFAFGKRWAQGGLKAAFHRAPPPMPLPPPPPVQVQGTLSEAQMADIVSRMQAAAGNAAARAQ